MKEKQNKFSLAEPLNYEECKGFGLTIDQARNAITWRGWPLVDYENATRWKVWAIRRPGPENFRCPRKGEWYLSGARPMAWRAPNDFTGDNMKYRICALVLGEVRYVPPVEKALKTRWAP
jgi:hypothetical protein